jgi:lambda family phage portal protein
MKNIIDSTIEFFSPVAGAKRAQARAALAVVNSGYDRHGASKTKKSLRGWLSKGGSPEDDIVANLETLRDRSLDLYMGTPIATGALKTIRTNVIGSGLRLNCQIDYEYLGLTKEQADQWERNTEREWKSYSDTTHCDAARTLNFGQMQGLALLSAMTCGDTFAVMPIIKRKGSTYDVRVSLIESHRVCNPAKVEKGRDIAGGIEVDQYGAPETYFIAKHHPGDSKAKKKEWAEVPAFGRKTGRRNVLHIMQDYERIGQRRGIPVLAPVIESLKQLGRYTDAELMAAVVSGMFTVFVKSENGAPTDIGAMVPLAEQVDTTDQQSIEMGNGAIVELPDGQSIETADPGRPNTAFNGFVDAICEQIGVALELPKDLLVKRFNASYTASRAALLEAWKMFKMRRHWMAMSFCQPVYEEWLAEAVAKGRVDCPGFFGDESVRAAWSGSEWHGPSQGQLNPLQEATAAKVRVEQEFSTRERETAEMNGMNWDNVHKTRSIEERKRRDDETLPAEDVAKRTNMAQNSQNS